VVGCRVLGQKLQGYHILKKEIAMDRKTRMCPRFPGKILLVACCALPLGCASTGGCEHPILQHCSKEPLTVVVAGLVKNPGPVIIPLGGLMLRDAIGLAGGDVPFERFEVPAANVLVSIDRPEGVEHFALPLVTNDYAGRVFLRPNDRVTLEQFSNSALAPTVFGSGGLQDAAPGGLQDAVWKSVVARDTLNSHGVEYEIAFQDVDLRARRLTVNVSGPPDTSDGPPAPGPVKAVLKADNVEKGSATLDTVSLMPGTSPADQTVLVLRRISQGKFHEYVLPRHGVSSNDTDSKAAHAILQSIHVVPGDAIGIDVLPRVPVVLTSLLAPQLFDFAKDKKPCLEALQAEHDKLERTLAPLTQGFKQLGGLVLPPIQALWQSVP
jgi:hypothetical protein